MTCLRGGASSCALSLPADEFVICSALMGLAKKLADWTGLQLWTAYSKASCRKLDRRTRDPASALAPHPACLKPWPKKSSHHGVRNDVRLVEYNPVEVRIG